jgi:hypothetical protein
VFKNLYKRRENVDISSTGIWYKNIIRFRNTDRENARTRCIYTVNNNAHDKLIE